MKHLSWVGLAGTLAALMTLLSNGCAPMAQTTEAQPTAAAAAKPRITILYDAFGKGVGTKQDWGYAALVEVNGKRILFDTGNNPEVFAQNVKAKGVDLTQLDFVVMSHRHSDHMGGLTHLLAVNPKVKIYAPKEPFGVYGSSLPSSFFRKADTLPPEMRYFNGAPPQTMVFGTAWPGGNFELIDKTTEVAPGIWLIAVVSDVPGTKELKELSLAINTPEGLVLVVACSHPGILNIVEAATTASGNKRVHLIAGGFHLLVAQDDAIAKVTSALHDTWKVAYIAPGHCTGEPTFVALREAFGDRYVYAGLGTVLVLGPTVKPMAQAHEPTIRAMDEADFVTYRTLLAQSDDILDAAQSPTRLGLAR
jgi:7,8-dihydropterin-6-yl-methyl-4-(beta-D-ribofuranosyl)aminobenzene 5'-phosphate synthase